jgi:hypothetical protein
MHFGTLRIRFHSHMLQLSFTLRNRQFILLHEGLNHLQSRRIQLVYLPQLLLFLLNPIHQFFVTPDQAEPFLQKGGLSDGWSLDI